MSGVVNYFTDFVNTTQTSLPLGIGTKTFSIQARSQGTGTYEIKFAIDVTNVANASESDWILDAIEGKVTNLKPSDGFGGGTQAWLFSRARIVQITGTASIQINKREMES